jgi:CheY-like chemotaxis protein
LLAGRKLLLADDSVTIQKVIDLTFADEGVRVIAFSNGQDAIDHLEEIAPDIVLADVFMPSKSGYEVCKYVKENEKLKHIPVMLLVGSFEPFDEAEARRVGADDILTKPFQSIRRLIDRVGSLVTNPPGAKEVATAELPTTQQPAEKPRLSAAEINISTADTQKLPEDLEFGVKTLEPGDVEPVSRGERIDAVAEQLEHIDSSVEPSDVLLDLGDFEPVHASNDEDFVLELDPTDSMSGQIPRPTPFDRAQMKGFVEPKVSEATAGVGTVHDYSYQAKSAFEETREIPYEDQVHETSFEPNATPESVSSAVTHASSSIGIDPNQLSPQMIDAIARRAVELMSDKVIREIAWEVVPDLAELLIKRHLEEKESQTK